MYSYKLVWMLCCIVGVFELTTAQDQDGFDKPEWFRFLASIEFRTIFHDKETNKLYVGGVNTICEFDASNVTRPHRQLSWEPEKEDKDFCLSFGYEWILCQNNIGVLQSVNETHLYACGTMAKYPTCTYILKTTFTRIGNTERGEWKSPYDPHVSTVSVMANQTLFTATLGNMQSNEGIISRTLNGITLRTEQSDRYWLNDPLFIDGYHVKNRNSLHDKVMIFFREKAEEFQPYTYGMSNNPNERSVVSRVATVCVNDHGGSNWVLRKKFATFTKMSIECTTAPDSTGAVFRYTHLESTYVLEDENDPTNPTIFGVFTMPNGAVAGSAVCAFNMSSVKEALATNQYWNRQQEMHGPRSNYTGTKEHEPGSCVEETTNLSPFRLSFGRKHPVKFGTITESFQQPHYQEAGRRYKHIVVDKIPAAKNSLQTDVTVLYMITDDGLLKRVVHEASNPPRSWSLPNIKVDIPEGQVDQKECVVNMLIGNNYLYVVTNRSITQIPLDSCSMYKTCNQCQSFRDPYCGLSRSGECQSVIEKSATEIAELSTNDAVCNQDSLPLTPATRLINLLHSRLRNLAIQNNDSQQAVTALVETKRESSVICEQKLTEANATIQNLTSQLSEALRRVDTEKAARQYTAAQLSVCRNQRNFILGRAAELSAEVDSRLTREQYNSEMQKLRSRNALASRLLRHRLKQIDNVTQEINTCYNDLQTSRRRIDTLNKTCEVDKGKAMRSVSKAMQTNRRKSQTMHEVPVENDTTAGNEAPVAHDAPMEIFAPVEENLSFENNIPVPEGDAKRCTSRKEALREEIDRLRKSIREDAQATNENAYQIAKQEKTIKQLTWLYNNTGEMVQQSCEHNGWFLSNASGNLFLLGKRRATFEQASAACTLLNARLAVFDDVDELRYINNVLRAFEPTAHFWVGLTKSANNSLQWVDGSPMNNSEEYFQGSRRSRLQRRTKLCGEITSTQSFNLIWCGATRRPICQKPASQLKPEPTPPENVLSILEEATVELRKSS